MRETKENAMDGMKTKTINVCRRELREENTLVPAVALRVIADAINLYGSFLYYARLQDECKRAGRAEKVSSLRFVLSCISHDSIPIFFLFFFFLTS